MPGLGNIRKKTTATDWSVFCRHIANLMLACLETVPKVPTGSTRLDCLF